jgi:hypothetical protein
MFLDVEIKRRIHLLLKHRKMVHYIPIKDMATKLKDLEDDVPQFPKEIKFSSKSGTKTFIFASIPIG